MQHSHYNIELKLNNILAVVGVNQLLFYVFDKMSRDVLYPNPDYLGDLIAQEILKPVDSVDESNAPYIQNIKYIQSDNFDNIDNMNSKLTNILLSISESILSKTVEDGRKLPSTMKYDVDFNLINC